MDITLTPDEYSPTIDDNGKFIDYIPNIINGIKCRCGARKDKIYLNSTKFAAHQKTKTHQKMLNHLNYERHNHYTLLLRERENTENQRKIIAQQSAQIDQLNKTIACLTQHINLNTPKIPSANLLDLD